jgi:hypothetical protein
MSSNWNTVNGGNTTEQEEEFDVKGWDDWLEANFGDCLLDQVQGPGDTDWSLSPHGEGESELPADGGSNGRWGRQKVRVLATINRTRISKGDWRNWL